MLSRERHGAGKKTPRAAHSGGLSRIGQDETKHGSRRNADYFVRRRPSFRSVSRRWPIWFTCGAGMGTMVPARAQPAQSHCLAVRIWLLTGSDQREQTRLSEMDGPSPEGAHHPSAGKRWFDLLESAARPLQHTGFARKSITGQLRSASRALHSRNAS